MKTASNKHKHNKNNEHPTPNLGETPSKSVGSSDGCVEDEENNAFQGSLWRQIGAVMVVSSTNFLQGCSLPTASLASAQLSLLSSDLCDRNNGSVLGCPTRGHHFLYQLDDLQISEDDITLVEISWLLGHLVSAVTSNPIAEIIGRKKSLVIDVIAFMCGFLLMALGDSVLQLCIGRLLLGYPLVSSVYLCEIVHPDIRGLSGGTYSTLNAVGYSLTLLLGAVLPSWRLALLILAILHLPILVLIIFVPESPTWLIRKGRVDEAELALKRLRGATVHHAKEFSDLKFQVTHNFKRDDDSANSNIMNVFKSMTRKNFLLPFFYLFVLYVGIGWSGVTFITYNSIQLFQEEHLLFVDKYYISFLVSLIKIPGGFVGIILMNFLPRSMVLQSTGLLVAVSHILMGLVYLSLIPKWWALVAITGAFFGCSAGYLTCAHLILGELLPANLRSIGVGLISASESVSTIVQTVASDSVIDHIGRSGLFFVFAGVVSASVFHAHFLMPETSGLTLEEIENVWLEHEQPGLLNRRLSCRFNTPLSAG
ncbi:hypothetical protein TCAL_01675 [Tigriopus californicus]|uniref:Major facilitator superfamily (MFS) profile domain-containing protein n=1 Tax=Tigriopus californicus TaxID=6832 RepID=A0A553PL49_TIGCA|nr:facilitated trehalose transporter Tret1-2 homolog [Tigriopus californicus]XP_059096327.1 facilitated trehalose transporter Tret1-2 homolog [Tigriopus californicus]TRY78417.1 hypothetical protein TCAL_01675 [Tigriopus californicus]